MQTISRILATFGLLFIAFILPALEISPTHVFNESWPPHARFHEMWQLITNAGIAIIGLWLVWRRGQVRLAAVLGVLLMGGAVASSALGPLYGGAITYDGGPTTRIFGIHAAILVPLLIVVLFLVAYGLSLAHTDRLVKQDRNGASN